MNIDTSTLSSDAFGRWPGILQTLGIDTKYLRDVHGPCPICGGKDRFRFDDKGNGRWICGQCGSGDGFSLLQKVRGWSFVETKKQVAEVVGTVPPQGSTKTERSDADKVKAIKRVMGEARHIAPGSPAWDYLLSRCGDPGDRVRDLWAHPNLKHSPENGLFPAMLAIIRYADDTGASIHRTFLTPQGQKAPVDPVRKIMSGFPLAKSSVHLGPAAELMGVAEGIETAICASKLFGMPVWAALTANGLKEWEPPAIAKEIVIFGDNDANYTGQEAAYTLARRLRLTLGLKVDVAIPLMPGADWADVWALENKSEVAA